MHKQIPGNRKQQKDFEQLSSREKEPDLRQPYPNPSTVEQRTAPCPPKLPEQPIAIARIMYNGRRRHRSLEVEERLLEVAEEEADVVERRLSMDSFRAEGCAALKPTAAADSGLAFDVAGCTWRQEE